MTFSQILRNHANDLEQRAAALEEGNNFALIKQAAVNSLVEGGMEEAVASEVLDGLKAQVAPESDKMMQKVAELRTEVQVLEKTAAYIDELEAKLNSAEAKISDMEKKANVSPELNVLAKNLHLGQGELDELNSLSEGTLKKIASSTSGSPWEIGSASSIPSRGGDDLLEFLMN